MQFAEVAEAVEVLKDGGFRLTREEVDVYRSENAFAELKRDKVVVRIVRERDRYFMELRPKYEDREWFDVGLVLRSLSVPELRPYQTDVAAMENATRHVLAAFDLLNEHFSRSKWRDTAAHLRELRERRWNERVGARLKE
ncbi:MAG: hypothetical protein ACREMY_07650 [bacterium]